MAKRRAPQNGGSLAGWLFADLSLLLAILFMSADSEKLEIRCEQQKSAAVSEKCEDSVSTPTTGGIKPKPIVVDVQNVLNIDASDVRTLVDRKIEIERSRDPQWRSIFGEGQRIQFGVVLLYGGAKGSLSKEGDVASRRAERHLLSWKGTTLTTYFESGHDFSLPVGTVRLKLFPLIPEQP